jgi:sugar/nucleoside kinase (ribokinase family)
MPTTNSILTIGSVALDSLEIKGKQHTDILGGSATYFTLIASIYAPILLSAVVGKDFSSDHIKLFKSRNINLDNFKILNGKTFRWGGKYSADLNCRETRFTDLGVFEHFQPNILNGLDYTGIVFLANIQPKLQLSVIEQLSRSNTIITDTMNLWIDLHPELLWKVIEKTNIFLLNDEEAIQLTGTQNLGLAAEKLLSSGPTCVIIKKGAAGCILRTNELTVNIPVYNDISAQDPTGAGDSFAGGFAGFLAQNGIDCLIDAAIHGTAAASFTVSEIGVNGTLKANRNTIDQRYYDIKKKMEILV